jgi:spore germination protein PB
VVKKMNIYVQQSISIQFLKIDGISNSSVLQIGSAGIIKPVSNLYNTGGFTGPAPEPAHLGSVTETQPPFVPLTSLTS